MSADLDAAEKSLVAAQRRFERTSTSDPNFIARGAAIAELEVRVSTLRKEAARTELGLPPSAEPRRVAAEFSEKSAEAIGKAVARIITERLRPLEERLAALESRPVMVDRGIWAATETYEPGSCVNHRSAIWVSRITSKGLTPGDSPAGWRLILRSPARGN